MKKGAYSHFGCRARSGHQVLMEPCFGLLPCLKLSEAGLPAILDML
ncbi:hypothetical protein HMPREF9176_1747 [Streptococcus downei F0415]|nr:hypothetical protein HMPREF9176_1747 [Streptococcus downei F0415]